MGRVHDLGGKLGYGPIDVNEKEEPFHADFEGRMWAISRSSRAPGINIDWWRHVRENIPADDYLNRNYFDSWAQTEMAAMIDAGVCTLDELIDMKSHTNAAKMVAAQTLDEVLVVNASKNFRFDRETGVVPKYAVGDEIQTLDKPPLGHTRLPEYACGKIGRIIAHRGAHLFPDAGAKGHEIAVHMYTVVFTACELWGDEADASDTVSLELWEPYFV
jgi:nitrile hydratase